MKLLHPLNGLGVVTQTFAEHVARAKRNGWCPGPGNCPGGTYYYGGLDIAAPQGTPIYAAADGTAITVRQDTTGYGRHVRIDHGEGYLCVYGHMSQMTILTVGTIVKAGDIIGMVGSTGNSSGNHLHFELRLNGIPIDPAPLIGQPEPEPEPIPLSSANPTHRITADLLNIRSGPGTEYPRLGTVKKGDLVTALRLATIEAWIEIEAGKWIAQTWSGETYAEPIE